MASCDGSGSAAAALMASGDGGGSADAAPMASGDGSGSADAEDAVLFEEEAVSGPPVIAKRSRTRSSDKGGGKRRAKAKSKGAKLCILCEVNPQLGKNPYCKADRREYDALKKDAEGQGRLDVFERARLDKVLFKKILEDYRQQCQPSKTDSGWGRPPYNFARMEEALYKKTFVQHGGEAHMKDYFDVLEVFERKRMTQSDADAYWRKLLNDPALTKDDKGLNPDFKTRVEWREEGMKRWFAEQGHVVQTVRASADTKSGIADAAFHGLASEAEGTVDFSDPRFQGMLNAVGLERSLTARAEPPPESTAASSKRPRCDAGDSSTKHMPDTSGAAAAARAGTGSVATGRLLAHDQARAMLCKAAGGLAKAVCAACKVSEGVKQKGEAERTTFKDYLDIIDERVAVATVVLKDVVPDVSKPKAIRDSCDEARAAQISTKLEGKVSALSFRPFVAVGEMLPLMSIQVWLVQLKKAPDEDAMKSILGKITAALPLVDELASAVAVACSDLDKAAKERERREKKAEQAAKAEEKRAERKAKQAEEQHKKLTLSKQSTNANQRVMAVYPFTAPLSVGNPMQVFKTWSEAKDGVSDEVLQAPFVVADASALSEFLDGEQCAVLQGKMAVFGKRWREADVVKETRRTQTRLSKSINGLVSFLNDVVRPPAVPQDVPEELQRLTGVALFGVLKGLDSFQPDYLWMNTLRYCHEGDRTIVAIAADDLLQWCMANTWVSTWDEGKWFQELQDFGEKSVSEGIVEQWKNAGIKTWHTQVGPKSCVYVPGQYFIWESVHSDSWGVRYTVLPLGSEKLTEMSSKCFDGVTHDSGRVLKKLSDWRAGLTT